MSHRPEITDEFPISPQVHFQRFRRLLEMEGEAERQRLEERRKTQTPAEAERGGETLIDMVIRDHTIGLG
ncbi:MAG: hypothetical protein KDA52_04440, partial [Planctomycetaceae bacterium]|nr:hypothetical protein [Planctomycetaceae bacterium]